MRQRLSVAGALLGDPQLLVLDEPANGLDPEGIRWLRDFLQEFVASGKTVFISSHVLAEVQQLVDEVVIIHRGRLVAQQTVDELTARRRGRDMVRRRRLPALRDALAARASKRRRTVTGFRRAAPPERVGEIAAADGIVLHELRAETATLEEAFLELTAGGRDRVSALFRSETVKILTVRTFSGSHSRTSACARSPRSRCPLRMGRSTRHRTIGPSRRSPRCRSCSR